jgi:predicted amidohydrolase YtcJ
MPPRADAARDMAGDPKHRAFTNGRFLTMAPGRPKPEVVVIEGDRIAAVGESAVLGRYPGALVEDLAGRILCPGFIDAHHHLSIAALHPQWADASAVSSVEELADVLAAQATKEQRSPWIRAAGWSDIGSGFIPHRKELDSVGLDRPLVVAHYSLHQAVVDSRGLDELGIGRGSPDPPGGEIGRDADGSPNGLLVERAWAEAHRRSLVPYDDPDRLADHIEALARELPADGITAIHDAACAPEAEAAYRILTRERRLAVAVLVCPHPARLFDPPDEGRLAGPPTGNGDEQLRIGPVKLFADGGMAPALDVHLRGNRLTFGTLFAGLEDHVGEAVSRGFRVAVHALGNAGLDAALEAFTVAARRGDTDHRFRVEHACLAAPEQLRRLGELGGVAVVQPGFLHHLGGQVEDVVFDDATWLPFADIAQSGAVMAASSDCPCTFHEPLRTSSLGASRRTASGRVLDAGQALSYEDWLRAYTTGAAYAGGQDHERGALAAGLRADLVVLEGELDADDPPVVAQTWIGGRLVYESRAQR